jgi:hypothetical protein
VGVCVCVSGHDHVGVAEAVQVAAGQPLHARVATLDRKPHAVILPKATATTVMTGSQGAHKLSPRPCLAPRQQSSLIGSAGRKAGLADLSPMRGWVRRDGAGAGAVTGLRQGARAAHEADRLAGGTHGRGWLGNNKGAALK